MISVQQIAEDIVAREGGFVNDPADPGGATQYGVTLGTLQTLRRDLTGDGRVDVADVHAMTRAEAVQIFIRHYFDRVKIGLLPTALQAQVFDMYVNSGANAVKILQRLLRRLGQDIADDGAIGPKTIVAVNAALVRLGGQALADQYGLARRDYYYALADARPASRKYALRRDGGKGGWITRAEAFLDPSLHLTQDQHQARVHAWH